MHHYNFFKKTEQIANNCTSTTICNFVTRVLLDICLRHLKVDHVFMIHTVYLTSKHICEWQAKLMVKSKDMITMWTYSTHGWKSYWGQRYQISIKPYSYRLLSTYTVYVWHLLIAKCQGSCQNRVQKRPAKINGFRSFLWNVLIGFWIEYLIENDKKSLILHDCREFSYGCEGTMML